MNHDLIVVEGLSFSYNRQNKVLDNVCFQVGNHEVVTVVGPNGGGKTTLFRLLIGMLKPDSGSIIINGKTPEQSRGVLGYVPQHAGFDFSFPMTVIDVVLSGLLKPIGFYSKKNRKQAEKALDDVGLVLVQNNHISELSGGQAQRMLIARALVSNKDILLLDEPTAHMDPEAGQNLNSLLKDLSREKTIITVSHDMDFVSRITERVFCVNKTLVEHPVDDVAESNKKVLHNIVLPYMKEAWHA